MAKATHHAAQRARERIGIPRKALKANMKNALRHGLGFDKLRGPVRSYVASLYHRHYTANNIRIYKNYVYVFDRQILITVFPLPEKHRASVKEILEKTGGTHNA